MGWNGMNSERIASKDCIGVDFGISDIEIQSLLLRFISAPSKWDIQHCKIKYLANTHTQTPVLYSVCTICQVFQRTKMYCQGAPTCMPNNNLPFVKLSS
jgi:hypothetical protein